MELIKEISEGDLGLENQGEKVLFDLRKAARAVLFNESGQIALLFVSKNNYHKLPGGGIEGQESIREALEREVDEEVGAKVRVLGEVGVIIEYRNQHKLLQISYCYLARVIDELEKPKFTDDEVSHGFELSWFGIDDALKRMKNDTPNDYVGKFIRERDIAFLVKAKSLMERGINPRKPYPNGLKAKFSF